jgi:hypothetical protein
MFIYWSYVCKERGTVIMYITKGINISCRTIGGIAFIFKHDTRELLELDKVGSFIWDQLNGCKTIEEILVDCCNAFEGNQEEISESVREFITILVSKEVAVCATEPFKGVMASAC